MNDRHQARLAELGQLEAGWHDGDGDAITDEAVMATACLLKNFPALASLSRIYPALDGGLQLELDCEGWSWAVEVTASGKLGLHGVQIDGDQSMSLHSDG